MEVHRDWLLPGNETAKGEYMCGTASQGVPVNLGDQADRNRS